MTHTTKKVAQEGAQAQPATLREAAQSVKDKAGKPRDRDYTTEYARRAARAMAKKRGADPVKAAEKAAEIVKAGEKSGAQAARMAVEDQLPLFSARKESPPSAKTASAEAVSAPPPVSERAEEPKVSPIAPEQIASLLDSVVNPICKRLGVEKLSKVELEDGGKAWAPVFDHYFPLWAAKTGPWLLAGLWTVQIGGSRTVQYVERRTAEKDEARVRGSFPVETDQTAAGPFESTVEEGASVDKIPAHQAGKVATSGT